MAGPVLDHDRFARAREAARGVGADPDTALEMLPELTAGVPLPGAGSTAAYLAVLAGLGAGDLTVARVVEPHLDGLAILGQAGVDAQGPLALDPGPRRRAHPVRPDSRSWGVFAAEGPGVRLTAAADASGWTLSGTKPWCSLADRLSHAVVTAHTGSDTRRAFAVDLRHPGVRADAVPWVSRGLAEVVSGPVAFEDVPAVPVGDDDWYLTRPGFAWGGIGVAAVWYGAACALADRLRTATGARTPDQVALSHLGATDAALYAAGCVLQDAAAAIDAGRAIGQDGSILAVRVRSVCAAVAEDVLTRVGHALGPAPLTFDEEHARRVADLTVYVRQHHAERDLARLGGLVLGMAPAGDR